MAKTGEIDQTIIKLAIVNSLTHLLAAIDFDIVDGSESELELADGSVFTIEVKRKRSGQRKILMKPRKEKRDG